jgi:hypothetical protein
MGVAGLKCALPQKRVEDWPAAFPGSTFLIDAANILFWCALGNCTTFVAGNYSPAVADFCKYMKYLLARNVAMRLYFDGLTNPDKQFEDERRDATREKYRAKVAEARDAGQQPEQSDLKGLVSNTSMYIALCAKACRVLSIPFDVCREEADASLAAAYHANPTKSVVVSHDTDMLAHGIQRWVSVSSWWGGTAVLIDVTHLQGRVPNMSYSMEPTSFSFGLLSAAATIPWRTLGPGAFAPRHY